MRPVICWNADIRLFFVFSSVALIVAMLTVLLHQGKLIITKVYATVILLWQLLKIAVLFFHIPAI